MTTWQAKLAKLHDPVGYNDDSREWNAYSDKVDKVFGAAFEWNTNEAGFLARGLVPDPTMRIAGTNEPMRAYMPPPTDGKVTWQRLVTLMHHVYFNSEMEYFFGDYGLPHGGTASVGNRKEHLDKVLRPLDRIYGGTMPKASADKLLDEYDGDWSFYRDSTPLQIAQVGILLGFICETGANQNRKQPPSQDEVEAEVAEFKRQLANARKAAEQRDRDENPDWAEIADIKKDRLAELRQQTRWADPT
jgi:hypothetical protein